MHNENTIVTINKKRYEVAPEQSRNGCTGCMFINRGCTDEFIQVCRQHKIIVKRCGNQK